MPTLRAAERILSAAVMLALGGFLPFSLKDGNIRSFGSEQGGWFKLVFLTVSVRNQSG